MTKVKSTGHFDPRRFSAGLQQLLDSLPSDSKKRELETKLDQIIRFVTELKTRLGQMPTREDVGSVRSTIAALENILADTSNNAAVRSALGLPSQKLTKKPSPVTSEDRARAEDMRAQLEGLTIDDMRAVLSNDDQFSIHDLYAIAKTMGMRSNTKMGRETLVHQIATRISNFRGYQDLGGGRTKPEGQPPEPSMIETDKDPEW